MRYIFQRLVKSLYFVVFNVVVSDIIIISTTIQLSHCSITEPYHITVPTEFTIQHVCNSFIIIIHVLDYRRLHTVMRIQNIYIQVFISILPSAILISSTFFFSFYAKTFHVTNEYCIIL